MSVTRQTTIWCDEEGCPEWIMADDETRQARGIAKQSGWVARQGGFDFCPSHSNEEADHGA